MVPTAVHLTGVAAAAAAEDAFGGFDLELSSLSLSTMDSCDESSTDDEGRELRERARNPTIGASAAMGRPP